MTAGRLAMISVALLIVGGLCVFTTSLITGASFAEIQRVETVDAAKTVILQVADSGPSALAARSASSIYDRASADGILPVLLSAWAVLAGGPAGADLLTLYRFGWLLFASCTPMALFWFTEQSFGGWVAMLSAVLLVATPSWLHGAAIGAPSAVTSVFWVLLAAFYCGSLRGERRTCWAIAFAALFGLALACDRAAFWIVAPLTVHFAFLRRSSIRSAIARGRIPLPAAALFSLFVSPAVLMIFTPLLWAPSARAVLEWLLVPLRETHEKLLYLGDVATGPYQAPSYAVHRALVSTPLLLLILAALGAWTLVRRRLYSREADDPRRVALLAGIVIVFALVVLPLLPAQVAPFPAQPLAVLPFIAFFAAIGMQRVAIQTIPQRARWFASAVTLLLATLWLRNLPTSGSFYNALNGGTAWVAKHKTFDAGDGSELAVLVQDIDGRGAESVGVVSPDVPGGYFELLSRMKRTPAHLAAMPQRGAGGYQVVRGERTPAVATVKRDDAVLWTLSEM